MTRFQARLDLLPEAQRRLWPDLKQVPRNFVLYGGTAIALRLGHRQSVDFDFFSSKPFDTERLIKMAPFLDGSKIIQRESQTLTVLIQRAGPVKLSFFGGLSVGRVGDPQETHDGILLVASLLDLAGMKATVIQKRAEAKDYIDLLTLLDNGIDLSSALGAAQALYGEMYNPILTLKAMSYFGDGDLRTLTPQQQERLRNAASQRIEIPQMSRIAESLSPV